MGYHYCYAVFAHTLAKAAWRSDRIRLPMAKAFIGVFTSGVHQFQAFKEKNTDDDSYVINSSYAERWFNGTEQIPRSIQRTVGDCEFQEEIWEALLKNMNDFVDTYLNNSVLQTICGDLLGPASCVSTNTKETNETLKKYFDKKNYCCFLTEALLIALTQENLLVSPKERKKVDKLKDDIAWIDYVKNRYSKPVQFVVPSHPKKNEIGYVQALLDAYASDAGVSAISEEELEKEPNYSSYKKNYDIERKYYYQAECIRESTRDSDVFNKKNRSFEGFKEELRDGLKDTYEQRYLNGYKRMFAVTEKAVMISISSLLSTDLKWINSAVRKGTVHIIISEEGEGWVKENDGE